MSQFTFWVFSLVRFTGYSFFFFEILLPAYETLQTEVIPTSQFTHSDKYDGISIKYGVTINDHTFSFEGGLSFFHAVS